MKLLERYIEGICKSKDLGPEVVHRETITARPEKFAQIPEGIEADLRAGLSKLRIKNLYTHQAQAIESILAGKDTVVVTPTASGKTLCYNLPVIQSCLKNPESKAMYVFPIKALEQDQLGAFRDLVNACGMSDKVEAEIYDGDTSSYKRGKIRNNPPQVVITNPDMIHVGMIPYHEKWEKFFKNLEYIVIDEVHTYRGVFGSHVAHVLRRLFRVAALYGSSPKLIACSATIGNPGELVSKLIGRDVNVIDENGAPSSGRHFMFINPTKISYNTAAARLLKEAANQDLATIVFTKARKITELIYTWAVQHEPKLRPVITAYRAGYLPEERREIEAKLFSGDLKGVVTTSALEMGIDIGVLDVCVLVGYPGAITTTWQRGGRVGRQDRESLIVLVAGQDALDQYFMKHPEVFFKSEFESAVVDPDNMPILKSHIQCAAAEMPLFKDDKWFSGEIVLAAISKLEKEGRLLRSVDEDAWHSVNRFPQRFVNIRGIGESNTIFEEPRTPLPPGKKPRVIGSIDGNRVYSEGHPGAIYLHRAKQYQITKLDLARKNMLARPVNVNYYTMPMREKETEILSTKKSKPVQNFVVRLGELKVTETITGYEKKTISGGERLSVHNLELPPYSFETVGLWIEMDDFIPKAVNDKMLNFMGGIHAIEHAAIALFPLFALCERNDVGGISIPLHPQVGKAAVFIYDGYPGGVGLSEQSYIKIEALLEKTLSLIENCDCEKGCPSCIHSPKCGNGNVPLDKESAVMILKMLLDKPEAKEWIELGAVGEQSDQEIISPKKAEPEPEDDKPRIMVMDIETKRSAQEVGGWNKAHLMRVAVAVVWDSKDDKMYAYKEDEVDAMLKHMAKADLVVGFNIIGFDYKVLSAYDDGTVDKLPTFDILYDVHERLGHRLSLDHLASNTLGSKKTADGLQSLKWVKQGRLDLVEEYCIKDVEITRDLLYHGIEKKYLRFERKNSGKMELAIDWEIDELVDKAKKLL